MRKTWPAGPFRTVYRNRPMQITARLLRPPPMKSTTHTPGASICSNSKVQHQPVMQDDEIQAVVHRGRLRDVVNHPLQGVPAAGQVALDICIRPWGQVGGELAQPLQVRAAGGQVALHVHIGPGPKARRHDRTP